MGAETLKSLIPENIERLDVLAQGVEKELRKRFIEEARITNYEKGYISVPSVNQLINMDNLRGAAFLTAYHYQREGIHFDKVVGIPNSGNPMAALVAGYLNIPLAPGRKGNSIPGSWGTPIVVNEDVPSFTTGQTSQFIFNGLEEGDKVLMVDDVIATGATGVQIGNTFVENGINRIELAVSFSKLFQDGVARVDNELGIETFSVIEVASILSKNEDGRIDLENLAPPQFA